MKDWLKGGLIGSLVGLLTFLVILIDPHNLNDGFIKELISILVTIFTTHTYLIYLIIFCGGSPPACGSYFKYVFAIVHILLYSLLGILIGLIIQKIKSKKKS